MKNIFTCDFTLVRKETANDKLLGKDSLHECYNALENFSIW